MSKKRIYKIAREVGISSKELLAKLEEMGMPGLKATNSVDDEEYALIVHLFEEGAGAIAESSTPKTESPVKSDEAPAERATTPKAARKKTGTSSG
ncbi:translation initiation factor IF-2 N-terminal domain-containing protein, partial [Candidatus Bipolaricaulota bacterium]|nr:translation initiation factor IF-2 N-terminal domain-containing protein [Candidatus Bipolaricaulota bacterium]